MKCHRVKDFPATHPPKPCDNIRDDVRSSMTHMHGSAGVRVCYSQVKLLLLGRGGNKYPVPLLPDGIFHSLCLFSHSHLTQS